MAKASANINSPDVIRRFRNHFVEFSEECRRALVGIKGDIRKTKEWLRHEQASYWRQQLRRREERAEKAKRDYDSARYGPKLTRKDSCVDEKKAYEKARRSKEEAEEKRRAVKKWTTTLDHEADKLLQPCTGLALQLDTLTPKALARLDRMLDSLDEYLRPSASNTSG